MSTEDDKRLIETLKAALYQQTKKHQQSVAYLNAGHLDKTRREVRQLRDQLDRANRLVNSLRVRNGILRKQLADLEGEQQ